MKKFILLGATIAVTLTTSCDPKSKQYQEEDTISQEILDDGATPSQYQGSTGVDTESELMDANENIQLKKQEFKGSFASPKTQNYELSVIETDEYTFSLESKDKNVKYIVTKNNGDVIVSQTNDTKTVTLEPAEYVITATLDLKDGEKAKPETEFTIHID